MDPFIFNDECKHLEQGSWEMNKALLTKFVSVFEIQ